jgi:pyridinium-3,5-biscarboxylic acid mononucleotide synthase
VTRDHVLAVLERVASGATGPAAALDELAFAPAESLAYATIDHHRALRQGYPEVIFAPGKTVEQAVGIAERIVERGAGCLVTRAEIEVRSALETRFPTARVNALARTVHIPGSSGEERSTSAEPVLIVTAGTSDLPVAEEAAETARAVGCTVSRLTDVGVAGIHRILAGRASLAEAAVVIVVAGMDGALPSVVGGLVRTPVIAVPTSVGYGASFGGLAALLTMINSCAAGVTVVNIDNGFGAAMAAARIIQGKPAA